MSPIIFNIVTDAVVREWERFPLAMDEGLKAVVSALFYADDGLLESHNAERVQQGLDKITELFLRVGLRMNATKTVVMISGGPKTYGRQGQEAYDRKVTGRGQTHRERMAEKISCPICNKEMRRQSLKQHGKRCHDRDDLEIGVSGPESEEEQELESQTHTVSCVPVGTKTACPVNGCKATAGSAYLLRRHFVARHPMDTIVVLQEGRQPLPRCIQCGMFSTVAETQPVTVECISCRFLLVE